jgi:EmrB/QacA subfamily drug resistance transporter
MSALSGDIAICRTARRHAETQAMSNDTRTMTTTPQSRGYPRRWIGLFAVLAATLMNLLDANVMNVAAPRIRTDLGGSYADLQWLTAAYTLAMAVGLLTGGRLGDMFGRKRMLLLGAAGFTIASVGCALAPSEGALISVRAIQGLVGAVMVPQGFGLIRDMFPAEDVGKAFGVFGPSIGLATILGPIVAGLLIQLDGWRLIFLINVPLGIFAIAVGARVLPAVAPTARRTRLDLTGTLLAGAGMFLLVFPLVQGRQLGWPAWTFVMLACSVPVFAGFGVLQSRRKRTGHTPLIELGVFAKRSYASGTVFVLVFFGAVVGISLTVGMLLQVGLGYTPIHASLTTVVWAIGAFVGTGVSAGLAPRLGRGILHLGLTLMAAGLAGVYLVLTHTHTTLSGWILAGPLLAFGIGMGMIFLPLYDIIIADISDREVGSAAGVLEAVQQLGASLGVAVLGTIFFGAIGAGALHTFDTSTGPRLRAELTVAGVPAAAQHDLLARFRICLHDRENATGATAAPASCRADASATAPAVSRALAAAGAQTHQQDSLRAAEITALASIALTALAFGTAFLLPARARPQTGPASDTEQAATAPASA